MTGGAFRFDVPVLLEPMALNAHGDSPDLYSVTSQRTQKRRHVGGDVTPPPLMPPISPDVSALGIISRRVNIPSKGNSIGQQTSARKFTVLVAIAAFDIEGRVSFPECLLEFLLEVFPTPDTATQQRRNR